MSDKSGSVERRESNGTARSDGVLAGVAMLYYKDGLTQSEIAKRIGLSRATVVNYLRLAREQGIVDIRIDGVSFTVSNLSKELRDRFGLKDVYIAEALPGARVAADERLRNTVRIAASALIDLVQPDDLLGVAWGETVHRLAYELPRHPVPGLTVCQMIGSMETPLLSTAESCAIRIASRLGAECHTLHAPAVLSTAELAETLKKEATIRSQLKRLERLDKVVFAVGDCAPDTHIMQSGIATARHMNRYRKQGAVGVLCGRFIDRAGRPVEGELDSRMIGVRLNELKAASARLLVASGAHKVEAIAAALTGGYATHLVTDADTAGQLIVSGG